MGTWSVKIDGNDTFMDVYDGFFRYYDEGEEPAEIIPLIMREFADSFDNEDEKHDCVFALAYALWETKSLTPNIYSEVRSIIENGHNLDCWRRLEADEKTILKRGNALEKFLKKISKEKQKPRPRKNIRADVSNFNMIFAAPRLIKSLCREGGDALIAIMDVYVNDEYKYTQFAFKWTNFDSYIPFCMVKAENREAFVITWHDKFNAEIMHSDRIEMCAPLDDGSIYTPEGYINVKYAFDKLAVNRLWN